MAEKYCGVTHTEDFQKPSGHNPVCCVLWDGLAWAGRLDLSNLTLSDCGPLQPHSVILWFFEEEIMSCLTWQWPIRSAFHILAWQLRNLSENLTWEITLFFSSDHPSFLPVFTLSSWSLSMIRLFTHFLMSLFQHFSSHIDSCFPYTSSFLIFP